ncbi:hypothetical protein [Actinoplanes siamensis]|uniref:Uncharacterized protein n=1 Tax=Actinoplanes siamensis TaxID=1223317 RepID=A0A919NCM4_9ACTN|nr:hypothetical protein [Actinoplanes siamensis]GIF08666.1 hypothetical protein Asi03nite_62040 [Actinoplanes siamensis]
MKIHLPVHGPDLPVHPYTGLTALALRRNGAPIWPIKGGAPDDDEGGEDDGQADDSENGGADQDEADDELGDAGKQAIDRMKAERNAARKGLRGWTALAREFGAKTPDEVRNLLKGKKSDGGDVPDPEQIRREARAEAEREIARDRLLDKIEAKASGRFADPADAAALLLREGDPEDFLDGTKVDADAITEALEDLLERKPYLASKAADTRQRQLKPDKSQGNRGTARPSANDRAAKRLERLGITKPSS